MDSKRVLPIALLLLAWPAHSSSLTSISGHRQPVVDLQSTSSSVGLADCISGLIDGRDAALGAVSDEERSELRELYRNSREAIWLDVDRRPTRNMRDALNMLSHAADEGLDPADYYQQLLTDLTPRLEAGTTAAQTLARVDVAVSAGMLRYLRDLHLGRVDPRTIGLRLDAPRDRHDFPTLLRDAMAAHRIVELTTSLQPHLAQYRLLREMLPRYRSLAADPAVVSLQPITRVVHPGDAYGDVGLLRRRLVALGDLAGDVPTRDPSRYEGRIIDGVKHFQIRHGLEPDGVLGHSTMAALRVPLTWRVRLIELALERLRWLPHLGDERLIALNIPMFRLWAWDTIPPDGMPLFGMDVIVGRALSTQTPVFVAEMDEVIFRPYWNVPRSILRHEVLPRIEREPGYLGAEDMEVVRGDGDNAAHVDLTTDALAGLKRGVLRVRQRPGPKNALGLVKFVFPNREDVYMHGTPAQALFGRSRRDFSHGCVRVEDPVALAEWALRDRPEWTRDRIVAATIGSQTIHVTLPRPIQVILFYTTAGVMPEDGTIRFADDIYRHDAKLDRALDTLHHIRTRPVSTWTKSDAG